MNKGIVYSFMLIAFSNFLIFSPFILDYTIVDQLGWLPIAGIVILVFLLLFLVFKAFYKIDDSKISILDKIQIISRYLTLIFILIVCIYTSFFVEKGYYSNKLTSQLNLQKQNLLNYEVQNNEAQNRASELKEIVELYKQDQNKNPEYIEKTRKELKEKEAELKTIKNKNYLTEKAVASMEERLKELNDSQHYTNMYFAMRVLSLGILGAILTLLAKNIHYYDSDEDQKDFLQSPKYWQMLITYCLSGAIVSLVVFALFYTKQISIFPDANGSEFATYPEFWRITLLGIVAGAFSDKIYRGVSSQVSNYIKPQISSTSARAVNNGNK